MFSILLPVGGSRGILTLLVGEMVNFSQTAAQVRGRQRTLNVSGELWMRSYNRALAAIIVTLFAACLTT